MTTRQDERRAFLQLLLAACVVPMRGVAGQEKPAAVNTGAVDAKADGYHVYPKDQIQDALEAAAKDPANKTVFVHAGTYRPARKGRR